MIYAYNNDIITKLPCVGPRHDIFSRVLVQSDITIKTSILIYIWQEVVPGNVLKLKTQSPATITFISRVNHLIIQQ